MAITVETKDCTALGDAELAEMADICASGPAGYEVGLLSKQREEWVLITRASVKRGAKRDTVLKALMADQYRRALLAFPDEDVLVGTKFIDAAGFQAFK